jgi:hypothetical protein
VLISRIAVALRRPRVDLSAYIHDKSDSGSTARKRYPS